MLKKTTKKKTNHLLKLHSVAQYFKSVCDVVLVSCSCKKQSAGLSSTTEALEKARADLEKCLSEAKEEHLKTSGQLHSQLEQSKIRTKELQKEVTLFLFSPFSTHTFSACVWTCSLKAASFGIASI